MLQFFFFFKLHIKLTFISKFSHIMYWFRGVWFGGFRSSMGTLILIYFTLAINKTVWYLEGWYEASLIWMSSDEEKKLNYRLSFPILSSCAISMVEWCCLLVTSTTLLKDERSTTLWIPCHMKIFHSHWSSRYYLLFLFHFYSSGATIFVNYIGH